MKTNYWNSRKYTTNATGYYGGSYVSHLSWLFSTGWGSTERYIATLQVRVPMRYYGSNSHIQFDSYPLGNSSGGSYYSAAKITTSGYNNGNFWADFSNLGQVYKKKVLEYGVYVNVLHRQRSRRRADSVRKLPRQDHSDGHSLDQRHRRTVHKVSTAVDYRRRG